MCLKDMSCSAIITLKVLNSYYLGYNVPTPREFPFSCVTHHSTHSFVHRVISTLKTPNLKRTKKSAEVILQSSL